MTEGSSTGLHVLGSVSDNRFCNTGQRSQMHGLPGGLSICRPLPGFKAVAGREYVVVIDCYVTEPCGSRGSESLPETVPVVHNFNPGRICRDQQRNGLFIVSGRCNGYPVSVACTGGVVLRAVKHPLTASALQTSGTLAVVVAAFGD